MKKTTRKLKMKAEMFAKLYVANGFNGVKAVKELYNVGSRGGNANEIAKQIASQNLQKPVFREAIRREMEKQELNEQTAIRIHKRNLEQDENLSASNNALDMFYKLTGAYAPETSANLNVNVDLSRIDEEIENTIKELKELT